MAGHTAEGRTKHGGDEAGGEGKLRKEGLLARRCVWSVGNVPKPHGARDLSLIMCWSETSDQSRDCESTTETNTGGSGLMTPQAPFRRAPPHPGDPGDVERYYLASIYTTGVVRRVIYGLRASIRLYVYANKYVPNQKVPTECCRQCWRRPASKIKRLTVRASVSPASVTGVSGGAGPGAAGSGAAGSGAAGSGAAGSASASVGPRLMGRRCRPPWLRARPIFGPY